MIGQHRKLKGRFDPTGWMMDTDERVQLMAYGYHGNAEGLGGFRRHVPASHRGVRIHRSETAPEAVHQGIENDRYSGEIYSSYALEGSNRIGELYPANVPFGH